MPGALGRGGATPGFSTDSARAGGRFQDRRFSAPRNQGKRASSTTILSAVVVGDAAPCGTVFGGVAARARRARWLRPYALPPRASWLRPYALPPRAPRRRSCSGDLLNKM